MHQQVDPTPTHDFGRTSRTVKPRTVGMAVIAVLALVFVLQNTDRGRISFWFWEITAPAWIWLLVLFLSGVVVGSMAPWFGVGRRGKHAAGKQKK